MMEIEEKEATPDVLWKKLIETFFRNFIAYFKPELLNDILIEKTEFLDKELLSITGQLLYENCLNSSNLVETALGILAPKPKFPRWKKKVAVINQLAKFGLNPAQIYLIVCFVDRLLPLKPREIEKFKEYMLQEAKEAYMIMTSFEEIAYKKGIDFGKDEGKIEGKIEGKQEVLMDIINIKFGPLPEALHQKLLQINRPEKLQKLIHIAIQADTLDQILENLNGTNQ